MLVRYFATIGAMTRLALSTRPFRAGPTGIHEPLAASIPSIADTIGTWPGQRPTCGQRGSSRMAMHRCIRPFLITLQQIPRITICSSDSPYLLLHVVRGRQYADETETAIPLGVKASRKWNRKWQSLPRFRSVRVL